jgi:type VI secretion system protein ImpH
VHGSAPDNGAADARARLLDVLATHGTSVEFFQAVQLLERLFPDAVPVGGFRGPAREVVRFRASPSLAFPASEIRALTLRDGQAADMEVTFLGLTGPSGVLPRPYTEQLIGRVVSRDGALRDFLDIFHHRLTSLFYRASRKTRPVAPTIGGGAAWLTTYLRAVLGLGTPGVSDRLPFPDEALLYYAGLLAPRPRSAAALRQLVAAHFGVPAEVEQFVGAWYPLASGTQCALGEDAPSAVLGQGSVVGDEVYDQHGRVRVRLGPLTLRQYTDFLPSGNAYESLRAIVRLFGGDDVDFELQLVLLRADVPSVVLGDDDAPPLGWSTWLRTREMERDADDAVLPL